MGRANLDQTARQKDVHNTMSDTKTYQNRKIERSRGLIRKAVPLNTDFLFTGTVLIWSLF